MAACEAFADDLGGEAEICCAADTAKIRGVKVDISIVIRRGGSRVIGGRGRGCTDSRVATGLAPAEWEGGK